MILLRLFNDGKKVDAQFLDLSDMKDDTIPNNYYKGVELIENEDVKDLLLFIMSHDDVTLDAYDEDAIGNPAQKLIYKELHNELTKVINSKKEILDKVDNEFKKAEAKYNGER